MPINCARTGSNFRLSLLISEDPRTIEFSRIWKTTWNIRIFGELETTTKRITAGKAASFNELQSTFGYGNVQMEAERALQTIRQRGPVSKYKAELSTQVVKRNRDDQAISSYFYRGLNDTVKDELALRENPSDYS